MWMYRIFIFVCFGMLKSVDFSKNSEEIINSIKTENKNISLLIARSFLYIYSKFNMCTFLRPISYNIAPEKIIFQNYSEKLLSYILKPLSDFYKKEQMIDSSTHLTKKESYIVMDNEYHYDDNIAKSLLEILYIFFNRSCNNDENFKINNENINKLTESLGILIDEYKVEDLFDSVFNKSIEDMCKFFFYLHQIEKSQKNFEENDLFLIVNSPHDYIPLSEEALQVLKFIKRKY